MHFDPNFLLDLVINKKLIWSLSQQYEYRHKLEIENRKKLSLNSDNRRNRKNISLYRKKLINLDIDNANCFNTIFEFEINKELHKNVDIDADKVHIFVKIIDDGVVVNIYNLNHFLYLRPKVTPFQENLLYFHLTKDENLIPVYNESNIIYKYYSVKSDYKVFNIENITGKITKIKSISFNSHDYPKLILMNFLLRNSETIQYHRESRNAK